jgi:LysM repeat protein
MRALILSAVFLTVSALADDVSPLAHRLKNCEIELDMLKNNAASQEQSREALEKEMRALLKATKQTLQDTKEGGVQGQKTVENALDKLTQDCKQLKAHGNELSKSLNELSKTVQEIKGAQKQQAQAIKELEQALRAITMAMGGGDSKPGSYTVKPGDSLGKIAKTHGMTVAELKELNQIQGSSIHPGQQLQVRSHE